MTDEGDSGQQSGPSPDISKLPGISAIRSDSGAAYLAAAQAQIDASGSSQQSADAAPESSDS
jgi:hypothetical protein